MAAAPPRRASTVPAVPSSRTTAALVERFLLVGLDVVERRYLPAVQFDALRACFRAVPARASRHRRPSRLSALGRQNLKHGSRTRRAPRGRAVSAQNERQVVVAVVRVPRARVVQHRPAVPGPRPRSRTPRARRVRRRRRRRRRRPPPPPRSPLALCAAPARARRPRTPRRPPRRPRRARSRRRTRARARPRTARSSAARGARTRAPQQSWTEHACSQRLAQPSSPAPAHEAERTSARLATYTAPTRNTSVLNGDSGPSSHGSDGSSAPSPRRAARCPASPPRRRSCRRRAARSTPRRAPRRAARARGRGSGAARTARRPRHASPPSSAPVRARLEQQKRLGGARMPRDGSARSPITTCRGKCRSQPRRSASTRAAAFAPPVFTPTAMRSKAAPQARRSTPSGAPPPSRALDRARESACTSSAKPHAHATYRTRAVGR